MSSVFGGQQINPVPPTSLWQTLWPGNGAGSGTGDQAKLMTSIMAAAMGTPGIGQEAYGGFLGLPGYPGQLTPDPSKTMLPGVFGAYTPGGDPGLNAMKGQVGAPGFGQMPDSYQQAFQNMLQYGVQSQYPGQMIHGMAQYGGTGGPGNYAMSSLLQTGSPFKGNPAGDALSTLATNPASSPIGQLLKPYMGAAPYTAGWQPMTQAARVGG